MKKFIKNLSRREEDKQRTSDIKDIGLSLEMKLIINNQILSDRKDRQLRRLEELEGEVDFILKELVIASGLVGVEKVVLDIFKKHQLSLLKRVQAVISFLHEEMGNINRELAYRRLDEENPDLENNHFHVNFFVKELAQVRSFLDEIVINNS